MKWKCLNCQNEHHADEPPETCPVCGARCAYTDGIGLDYAPKPGRGLRNGATFVCGICGTKAQVIEDKGGALTCCGEPMKESGA